MSPRYKNKRSFYLLKSQEFPVAVTSLAPALKSPTSINRVAILMQKIYTDRSSNKPKYILIICMCVYAYMRPCAFTLEDSNHRSLRIAEGSLPRRRKTIFRSRMQINRAIQRKNQYCYIYIHTSTKMLYTLYNVIIYTVDYI